ncbi:UNVERIFIED_CONTAM: hypothetical protein FKN15_066149 [Acipenser sinensis]
MSSTVQTAIGMHPLPEDRVPRPILGNIHLKKAVTNDGEDDDYIFKMFLKRKPKTLGVMVWITLMRFQQIKDSGQHSRTNTASLVLGLICSLGTSFVGNFQQSVLMGAHLFGAFLAFFVGGRWILPVRTALCSTCTGLIIISILYQRPAVTRTSTAATAAEHARDTVGPEFNQT